MHILGRAVCTLCTVYLLLRILILNMVAFCFKCYGTLDWITSEGHTAVVRYMLSLM